MKIITETKILFAVVFFTILIILGYGANRNIYEFKVNGKSEANYEYIGNSTGDFATEFSANFPYKTSFVDMNGLGRRIIGEREMNQVLKLNNGYLTQVGPVMKTECIEANTDAIISFNKYCQEHGTLFIYVQPAYKISKYDPQLPIGVTDGHNETIDQILDRLVKADVATIDLREEMYSRGIDQYDLYYRTDHHWTTEGAFLAYTIIAQWIADQTSTFLDPILIDLENYQIDTFSQWHLGSRGQRTGAAYAGIDDYDLIHPKFETHIQKRDDGTVLSLYDALVKTEVFQKANAQNRYTYDSAYTANDINNLVSLDAKSDLNVWLLSDSFQQAIKPYQLLTYRDFHVGGYGTLSTSFIQNNTPDVVIMLPWPGYFYEDAIFTNFVDDAAQQ